MKKVIYLLFVSMILFACSQDEQTSGLENQDGLVFKISTQSQLDLRAGDPVYSQDATHKVSNVVVYAFLSDGTDYKYVRSYPIDTWTSASNTTSYTVSEGDELDPGDYKFLAVGRDASDNYGILPSPLTAGITKFEEMLAAIAVSGDEYELFAGEGQATLTANGGTVSILMRRKVAGVLGYFTNVPQKLGAQTVGFIRLIASAGNLQVNLSSGVGSSDAPTYDIIRIDLTGQQTTTGDPNIGNGNIYTGNANTLPTEINQIPNSQLSGAYMIPVNNITLTLGLYEADGTTEIETWTVKNAGSEQFDILPNNFYSLGTKYKADTTNGSDGIPSDDDDKGINISDLLGHDGVTITIDPAWETINYLNL